MTVNYTTNLALGQPVTGTESGTWGDDVNNSVTSYLDIAIAGGLAITITTADVTLTNTQGTSSATNIGSTTAQYAILNISGAMTAARNLILPSSSRQYVINNNTTGGFALTVKGVATSGVTMVNGEKAHIFWNGTDYAKAANTAGAATFTTIDSANTFGFKNRIINGNMVIDQRNAGAAVTAGTSGTTFSADRWGARAITSGSGVFTVQQVSTAPAGFKNSIVATVTTSGTVGATDQFFVQQRIEGYNIADLGLGTATPLTFTVSFWVRSSLTGAFGGNVGNNVDISYPFSFTISAANTWEQKTVTIAGTSSGTWASTNGVGLIVSFSIGTGSSYLGTANVWANYPVAPTGSTNVIATASANLYITGVQLEKGSAATSFDFRSYGTELVLCQRYLPAVLAANATGPVAMGFCANATLSSILIPFLVQSRVRPTGVTVSSAAHFALNTSASLTTCSAIAFADGSLNSAQLTVTNAAVVAGQGCQLTFNSASGSLLFTGCEL